MASLQDVQNSLGFLALQAEAADEQRKQKEAFAREQAAAESSAQGFDRMTQMLSVLDARRQAKHDRDMEVAQLAGKAGVALSDEQGNEAKGRFAIGEALSAAEERRLREREEARLSLEAFQQRGQDRRAEEARKAAMERTDKYINATNQRTELNIDARDRSKAADIASREKIAEMKKKPGKGGGAKTGSGWPATQANAEGKVIPWTKAQANLAQKQYGVARDTYKQLVAANDQLGPAEVDALMTLPGQARTKFYSMLSQVVGGTEIPQEEIDRLGQVSGNLSRLAMVFNALGKERSGASFTEGEVARLRAELPTERDAPAAFPGKMRAALKVFDEILKEKERELELNGFALDRPAPSQTAGFQRDTLSALAPEEKAALRERVIQMLAKKEAESGLGSR